MAEGIRADVFHNSGVDALADAVMPHTSAGWTWSLTREDCAGAALFLASARLIGYVTGQRQTPPDPKPT